MLILSRKPEEEIRIGENVTIKVLAIHNGQVKLGIEAPRETRVFRAELYGEIQAANVEASQVDRRVAAKTAASLIKPKGKK
ncbi:MAG TPA: carbon storage regulator CsrA [Bacteroidota bacterium]|nr:carbon storage regulator CsrA [Bacteroidota bacterium]